MDQSGPIWTNLDQSRPIWTNLEGFRRTVWCFVLSFQCGVFSIHCGTCQAPNILPVKLDFIRSHRSSNEIVSCKKKWLSYQTYQPKICCHNEYSLFCLILFTFWFSVFKAFHPFPFLNLNSLCMNDSRRGKKSQHLFKKILYACLEIQ